MMMFLSHEREYLTLNLRRQIVPHRMRNVNNVPVLLQERKEEGAGALVLAQNLGDGRLESMYALEDA